MSTYTSLQPSPTASVAREHINDLLLAAEASRLVAGLPAQRKHRTPRRRRTWWSHVTARSGTPSTA